MKEQFLVKMREFLALFLAAVKCEGFVMVGTKEEIEANCGDCIYCWIVRKIMVMIMFVMLGSISPVMSIALFLVYIYLARDDFRSKMGL